MERKRTLKLNWDNLGDDDDDQFFDPRDRLSCAAPIDLAALESDDSDDEFEDSRLSLSADAFSNSFRGLAIAAATENHAQKSSSVMEDYGMWMADPGDIKERRKRLLQGMGLVSNKDLLNKVTSSKIARAISRKPPDPVDQKPKKNSSEWIKVQQQGKTHKEFTGLQLCQEIQAHEGSIWTIKFSWDARYLASAGEDRVIHIWEVQDVEVIKPSDEQGGATPLHPSLAGNSKAKASTKKKDSSIPDYVNMPESVFAFSEKPFCTLTGHQDEVLDLSWSKSQLLLSSSMDKTVRLWNIENQSVQSHEHFPCKDVSVAISWPGSIKNNEPSSPLVEMASKRQPSKRSALPPQSPVKDDSPAGANKKNLPPPLIQNQQVNHLLQVHHQLSTANRLRVATHKEVTPPLSKQQHGEW